MFFFFSRFRVLNGLDGRRDFLFQFFVGPSFRAQHYHDERENPTGRSCHNHDIAPRSEDNRSLDEKTPTLWQDL